MAFICIAEIFLEIKRSKKESNLIIENLQKKIKIALLEFSEIDMNIEDKGFSRFVDNRFCYPFFSWTRTSKKTLIWEHCISFICEKY